MCAKGVRWRAGRGGGVTNRIKTAGPARPQLVVGAYVFAGTPRPGPLGRQQEGSEMLVLSRKLGEKIYIGDNICITVVDIDRGKIRLGIEAPRDVPIYRQELLPLKPGEPKAPKAPNNSPAAGRWRCAAA